MFAFGLIGYFMRKYGYPVAPAVPGLVLGDPAELSIRRSLLLNFGNPMLLVSRPLSVILLAGALVSTLYPIFKKPKSLEGLD